MVVKLWDPPRLPPNLKNGKIKEYLEAEHEERSANTQELFFDLILVVALTQLSELLYEGVRCARYEEGPPALSAKMLAVCKEFCSQSGTTKSVFVLTCFHSSVAGFFVYAFAFFQIWLSETFYHTRFDGGDDLLGRLLFFMFLLALIGLSVCVSGGFDDIHSKFFAVYYIFARFCQVCKMARIVCTIPQSYYIYGPIAVAHGLDIILWIITIFLSPNVRLIVWPLSLFVLGIVLTVSHKGPRKVAPVSPTHFPERFSLFMMFVIGEQFFSLVKSGSEITFYDGFITFIGPITLGFLITFIVYWIYFDNINGRIVKHFVTFNIWIWCHFLAMIGSCGIGASMENFIAINEEENGSVHAIVSPSSSPVIPNGIPIDTAALYCWSFSSFFFGIGIIHNVMVRREERDKKVYMTDINLIRYFVLFASCVISACLPFMKENYLSYELIGINASIAIIHLVVDYITKFYRMHRIADLRKQRKIKSKTTENVLDTPLLEVEKSYNADDVRVDESDASSKTSVALSAAEYDEVDELVERIVSETVNEVEIGSTNSVNNTMHRPTVVGLLDDVSTYSDDRTRSQTLLTVKNARLVALRLRQLSGKASMLADLHEGVTF